MRKTLLFILTALLSTQAFASHIVGGEIFYTYIGPGSAPGTSIYSISIRLIRDCDVACGGNTNVACLPKAANIAIYTAAPPYVRMITAAAPLIDSQSITLTTYPSCVTYKPPVCYEIKTYSFNWTLPDNNDGYILAYQDCCRALAENQNGVEPTASGLPGATYTAVIPGKMALPAGHNNSAVFKIKDTALVCLGGRVNIDFSASDKDGDSLSYRFEPAYNGGGYYTSTCMIDDNGKDVCDPNLGAGKPPYKPIATYSSLLGFTGDKPLGPGVSINPVTGLITGYAPAYGGRYIVNVFVDEWRGGKLVATHQKDFIVRVEECGLAVAKLDPYYENCKTFTLTFENRSTSAAISSYYWTFGDKKAASNTSTDPVPVHTFTDTGVYKVTLITNRELDCTDTATMLAKVYPGFVPDFSIAGGCILTPYVFTDHTISKYGIVNNWRWDFGDFNSAADTSHVQNPQYVYAAVQKASPQLIVSDTKGCIDTTSKPLTITGKLQLHLSFNDSLICLKDSIQLNVIDPLAASTVITWSPPVNISNTGIVNPFVYPGTTTVYYIAIQDNGCSNNDSVRVRVITSVTINAGSDTTICLGDSIKIFPATNATSFTWSPAVNINNINAQNPVIKPVGNTLYKVFATAGSCRAGDSIMINTVPYPQVMAGADTAICVGKTARLFASTTAAAFTWRPANSLLQPGTLAPLAGPQSTTAYIITVTDTLGCPKPVSDTTIVTVSHATAFAGNDTTIVAGQPLQLNVAGNGNVYSWYPATGLDNPGIANPVAILGIAYDSVIYQVTVTTAGGCMASDDIKVVVFKTRPDIFVPSAFTPNGDRLNDVLRPKPVGIKQFNRFNIYNRFGQLVFSTAVIGDGWDGSLYGVNQPAGTYVYMAQAIDYTGRVINKKGTIVLIR